MTGYVKAIPPGVLLSPPKWGLTPEQWRVVNDLAWEYEQVGPLREFPGFASLQEADAALAPARWRFFRWLYQVGRLHETCTPSYCTHLTFEKEND